MKKPSKLDWYILDNLSNDWECLTTIYPEVAEFVSGISRENVVDAIHHLIKEGYIQIRGGHIFDKEALLSEPEEYLETKYWFGLTTLGCEAWEAHSVEYAGYPIDWTQAWSASISFENREGHIDGVSKEVCLAAINKELFLLREEPFEIDKKSMKYSKINGFNAKYYKYISGGCRISFKLRRSRTVRQASSK